MQAAYLELANSPTPVANFTGAPILMTAKQGICPLVNLEADDLLGVFTRLREDHEASRRVGGRGIVVVVLVYGGARLAFACRLDAGTI